MGTELINLIKERVKALKVLVFINALPCIFPASTVLRLCSQWRKGPTPPGFPNESEYPSPSHLVSVPGYCCLSEQSTCTKTHTNTQAHT